MLTLYRRHLDSCAHASKGRRHKRCKCPVWVDGTYIGMEVRRSLKTRSWNDAEWELEKLKESPAFIVEPSCTIQEAVGAYLNDARAGQRLAADTLRKYRNVLSPLEAFCEDRGKRYLKQVTFDDLLAFRATWPDNALSASKKLERLKSFFRFCVSANWIKINPAGNLKRPKVIPLPTLPFSEQQVNQIVQACNRYPNGYGRTGQANAQRLKALVLVLRYSGMRIRDAVQLEESKVQSGRIFLYQQKTGEPVYVPIPTFVNAALSNLKGRTSKRFYFWSGRGSPKSAVADWQRSFRKLFALAGITHEPQTGVSFKKWKRRVVDGKPIKAHPHMFRDTFAVELLLAGVPMEDVQILLGHTSIRTTERNYAPWVKARQERLEKQVTSAWKLNPTSGTQRGHDRS